MGNTNDFLKKTLLVGAVTTGILSAGNLTPKSWQASADGHKMKTEKGAEGKCGAGKCGEKMKMKMKMKKEMAKKGKDHKCGESKCGAKKKAMKGKKKGSKASCGESSCG